MGWWDGLLGRVGAYRTATITLLAVHAAAALLGHLGMLDVDPVALAATVGAASAGTLLTSLVGALVSGVRAHVESSLITGLLLALLLWPALTFESLVGAGLVGAAAGISKVLVRWRGRHLLNPAAAGALVAGLVVAPVLGTAAPVWWVATPLLAPVVLVAGLLVLRRTGTGPVAVAYGLTYLAVTLPRLVLSGQPPLDALASVLGSHPVLVVAAFMVVEPLTQAPRRRERVAIAVLVGGLAGVPFAVGPLSTSPELAIVAGNVVAALVAAPRALRLVVVGHGSPGPGAHEVLLRPARPLRWQPGQWAEIDVVRMRPDGRGRRRVFSLVPAGRNAVAVAFSVRERPSAFKRALLAAPVGSTVRATYVGGDFLLPDDPTRPVLMIAGGIGVTPFISQIEHAGPRDMVLVLVCPTGMPPPYLRRLARTRVRVVIVSPEPVPALPPRWTWHCGTRLTSSALRAVMPDLPRRAAYVSGSPDLVRRARAVLREVGVRRVRTDTFTGYGRRPAHRSPGGAPPAPAAPAPAEAVRAGRKVPVRRRSRAADARPGPGGITAGASR
ncbi:FAD-dependent oxidoreductase [Cellulomonas dongxiuzhuiae]|uniref:FAD-dependent oxidoreductase n=1 Tax=Cellulomonas dongxiuzhuiae TaxID=2819979 RepID=UPI001AAFBCCC|nr:FAD-dependent oxidoreductase [Cellulomonas dongxiuzhuiae]MBO3086888.1 FAD-dependent oxidoreductase [Cellulomonas dongxiuzhuiae]